MNKRLSNIFCERSGGIMVDGFGRSIEYLRISVTERCNLRCIYCSPQECLNISRKKVLSPGEFEKIVDVMSKIGVKRVRLTGGEPLLREDICEIISRISANKKIEDISLTTNGVYLAKMAKDLKKAGLKRINVSLDTLKPNTMKVLSKADCFDKVIMGINKSIEVGLTPIRTNTVFIKGINDGEMEDFINLAKTHPIDVRFIELMPMGENDLNTNLAGVTQKEILKKFPRLREINGLKMEGPAIYYTQEGLKGRIGFISSMSHRFCSECNRVRLTCDGKLRLCLANDSEVDLVPYLNKPLESLREYIEEAISKKPKGHCFDDGVKTTMRMKSIGG